MTKWEWFKWIWLNDDEPIPPDGYLPDSKYRIFWWHLRNPLHNFFHYVVGIRGQEYRIEGECTPTSWGTCEYEKWGPDGVGWHYLELITPEGKKYPFVSHRSKRIEWYIGWGPKGDFGMSLRRANATNAGEM